MKKYSVFIIDDEPLARQIVKKNIESYSQFIIEKEISNGFDAVKLINELKPDLIFLDVQMPKLTGFEVIELLDFIPSVIFITAYDQFAIKAFEVNAVDYLLKPFSKERFDDAINKFLNRKTEQKKDIDLLKKHLEQETLERILIKDRDRIIVVPVEEIIFIEAQDDYVKIYSTKGKFLKQFTMSKLENHLPANKFIRIHRSYIVAFEKIKELQLFEKESYKIILEDGTSLPVSKSGYQKLKSDFYKND